MWKFYPSAFYRSKSVQHNHINLVHVDLKFSIVEILIQHIQDISYE